MTKKARPRPKFNSHNFQLHSIELISLSMTHHSQSFLSNRLNEMYHVIVIGAVVLAVFSQTQQDGCYDAHNSVWYQQGETPR